MQNSAEVTPDIWYSFDTGTVMLDVTDAVEEVQPQVIDQVVLSPKTEYHCSLVSIRHEQGCQDSEAEVVETLTTFLQTTDIRLDEISDERYLCTKEGGLTIIAPVRLVGERALRSFIKGYFPGYDPFFHVTLLKSEDVEHGIRVSSVEELVARCVKL